MTDEELDIFIEQKLTEMTIKILGNIKSEIEEKQSKYTDRWIMSVTDYPYGCYRAYEETIKLIDRHIFELKGE